MISPLSSAYNKIPVFKGVQKKDNSIQIKGSETSAKVYTPNIDYKVMNQIKVLCNHPAFKDAPIRIMPDVHPSKNTLVGFSAPVDSNKIIPGIIGSDIGCGMLCVKFDTQGKEIDYKKLDETVKMYSSVKRTKLPRSLKRVPQSLQKDVKSMCKDMINANPDFHLEKLGTIGSGNHFVEIDTDKDGQKYLIIHTGSRSLGKQVAQHHQFIARHQNHYFIPELSYLSDDEAKKYMEDMKITQEYAKQNRRTIADEIMFRMGWKEISSFESVHNYISENGIIRKGAIAADKGKEILIPLNMRDGAILATGKGNADWNNTAPHGAGRKMARGEANSELSYDDYVSSMRGIYSSSVKPETLDEAPAAYKNSSEIIENITDTADVKEVIKPLYNFKD